MDLKTYNFHVSGTHCASCKILIEDILREQDFIKSARVDLSKETVVIEASGGQDALELAKALTDKIKSHGYALTVEKSIPEKKADEVIWKAIPIGLFFLALFFL